MRLKEKSPDSWIIKSIHYSWYILLITFFSLADNGFTQGQVDVQRIANPLTAKLAFEAQLGYDDNIFDYSPRDIERFTDNEKPSRFLRVKSYDDFVSSEGLMLELRKRLWRNEVTRLRFKSTLNQYLSNPLKNYQPIILSLRQGLPRGISFQVEYLLIPHFYIRDYYDSDLKEYMKCSFQEHLVSLRAGRRILRNTNAAAIYKWQTDSYDHCFREYDTQANIFGAAMSHRPIKDMRLDFEYLYKDARARGYDEEGETRLNSDDSDISYRENALEVGLEWDARKIRIPPDIRFSIEIGYEYKHRSYTTEKSIERDPSHSGRQDDRHIFSSKIQFRISPNLLLNLLYGYKKRNANSPENVDIGESKNYTNHTISAGVIFAISNY